MKESRTCSFRLMTIPCGGFLCNLLGARLGRNHQNNASTFFSSTATMGRNKASDDIDHVPIDDKHTNASKKPPPKPRALPEYHPINIKDPFTYGQSRLPPDVDSKNPYAVFSLFFNESTLQTLVNHTNEYAELYPGNESQKTHARTCFPTTVREFRAYVGVYVYMGVHPETAVEDFWNTNPMKPVHSAVRTHISLMWW